jgi:hypothetical protein
MYYSVLIITLIQHINESNVNDIKHYGIYKIMKIRSNETLLKSIFMPQ